MTDINISISQGGDDVHAEDDGSNFNSNYNGLYLGNDAGNGMHSAFVFRNIQIPQGAEITNAFIRFKAYEFGSATTCNVKIHCEDEDDATVPTSGAELIGVSKTTGTAWDSIPTWSDGNTYDSPDIKDELQTVVNRLGWQSGNKIGVHFIDNISSASAKRRPSAYDFDGAAEKAVLYVTFSSPAEVEDSFTIDDQVDAFSLTDELTDEFTVSDTIDAQGGSTFVEISDDIEISDGVDAYREIQSDLSDQIEIDDQIDASGEIDSPIAGAFTVSDLIDGFNWSAWFRDNADRAVTRYYFTLTGSNDATTDIEIPITSFQARKRDGQSTYLSVVTGYAYADQINARSNGEMVIEMAYLLNGVESIREEILRADLEDIPLSKGARSRSVTLTGHKTVNFSPKVSTIENPTYRYLSGGKLGFRFAKPDLYVNPGDTCRVGDDEFVIDWISYVVSARSRMMEIREV